MSVTEQVEPSKPQASCGCGTSCDTTPVTFEQTSTAISDLDGQRFRIANMDCASEESAIRHALKKLGTNQNEVRMDKITLTNKVINLEIDNGKDEVVATEEIAHTEVSSTTAAAASTAQPTFNESDL